MSDIFFASSKNTGDKRIELIKRESGGRDSNPRKIGLQPIAVAAVPPPHAPDRIRTCDLLLSSAVKTAD